MILLWIGILFLLLLAWIFLLFPLWYYLNAVFLRRFVLTMLLAISALSISLYAEWGSLGTLSRYWMTLQYIQKLNNYLEVHPENKMAWYLFGRLYANNHQFEAAEKAFKNAKLALAPKGKSRQAIRPSTNKMGDGQ